MFCAKCGIQVENEVKFCSSCGGAVGEQVQAPIDGYISMEVLPPKKSVRKLICIIACIMIVVTAISVTLAMLLKVESPETVAEKYLNASYSFDYDSVNRYSVINEEMFMKALPLTEAEFKEKLLDEYGMTDIKKIFQGPMKEEAFSEFKDGYGADYKITFSVFDITYLSNYEMRNMVDSFRKFFSREAFDVNELTLFDKIEEICIVSVEAAISGSKDRDTNTVELHCAKIDGRWKVLESGVLSYLMFFNPTY